MPFNLDLSTIQEATFNSEGTITSAANSPDKDQKKRSILRCDWGFKVQN